MTFKQYLTESKNTHLEHIEDGIINGGIDGTRDALNFLRGIRNMLAGHSDSKINVTVKYDGAPAVFCGTDPETGKFFVGTKSIFNKTPKVNFTNADIDRNHPSPGLNEKLKVCLKELPSLKIKGVIQGDLMFTKGDIQRETIEDEKLLIFKPNTIVYAVPVGTPLAKQLLKANLGIVFHTQYTGGPTLSDMKASFGVDVSKFAKTPRVWYQDSYFRDMSGNATLTKKETEKITKILSKAGKDFQKLKSTSVNQILAYPNLLADLKIYNNAMVRAGSFLKDPRKHTTGFAVFVKDKYRTDISKLKTEKARQRKQKELDSRLAFIASAKSQLQAMFVMQKHFMDVKLLLLNKLKRVKSLGHFLETPDGYRVTSPEGFVAIDHIGNAVKLVDRLEFSKANFMTGRPG